MTTQQYAETAPFATGTTVPPTSHQADGSPEPRRRGPGHPITCMASLDPALRVIAADADFFRQFGKESAEVIGHSLYELLHPSSPALLNRHFSRLADGRRTRFVERVIGIRGENDVFSGELTGIAVQSEAGQPPSFVVMVRADDMSSASAAAAAIAQDDSAARRKQLFTQLDAQILEGVASGASTVQLAARLYLSRQGVEYHVGLMLRRLKAPNRAALVARAHSMGMLTVGSWPPRVLPEFVKDADNRRGRRSADGAVPRQRGTRQDAAAQAPVRPARAAAPAPRSS